MPGPIRKAVFPVAGLGTRFLPADRKPPEEIGLVDLEAFPMTWWAQILSPLRWAQIRAQSQQPSAAARNQNPV